MFEFLRLALVVIGAGFGSYIGSYVKKKGENLALREDLDDLVKQVEETTKVAKAIEARISNEVWGRQRHWEMKRDAIVSAIQSLEHTDDALIVMAVAFSNARKNGEQSEMAWKEMKSERQTAWHEAINIYDRKRVVANLVCSNECIDALRAASIGIRSLASKLFKGEISSYDEMGAEVQKLIANAYSLARKELGIDAT